MFLVCLQIASQLRLFDPQLRERPEEESFVEPAWLVQLRRVERQVKVSVASLGWHLSGAGFHLVLGMDRTAGRPAGLWGPLQEGSEQWVGSHSLAASEA